MSHFGHHEMAEMRQQFVAGCQRPPPGGPGMSSPQAETLWDQVLAFAGYGFNQGHATSYAVVSYRSAFLKTHWPASFLCARLGNWGGYHHPSIYMAEAVRLGLRVRPPHVNESGRRFALGWVGDQAVLWMGLARVRDLRRASIRALLEERQQQAFAGARDLARRVPMQRKELAHLIQCGALDGLGESRAALLAEADEMERAGSTLQMAFAFSRPQVPAESPVQRLNWEQQLLGQPVSVHPLELVADRLAEHLPLQHLPDRSGHRVAVAGVRLPGWTGGQGFFLGDARTFVVTRYERTGPAPRPWQPLIVEGRWLGDEWGGWWLQVDKWEEIPLPDSTP
jgi:DNA polymerase III alpha subunit